MSRPSASGQPTTSSTAHIFRPAAPGCLTVKGLPATLRYENHVAAAAGAFGILDGRFSGIALPAAWVVAASCAWRMGVLAEHRDVIRDDATREQSRSGLPMFGDRFPT